VTRAGRLRSGPLLAALLFAVPATAAIAAPTPTPATPAVPSPVLNEKADFDALLGRLSRMKSATVSTACGSASAPWAYRGERGRATMLRPYRSERAGEGWTRRFVATLFRSAAWDTIRACSGAPGRNCDGDPRGPLVVVTLNGKPDVYALLSFEKRCAIVFEADRALGAAAMGERADTILALLREVFADEPSLALLPPPLRRASGDTLIALGDSVMVEDLPEPVHRVAPRYPDAARAAGRQGVVEVMALLGRDGAVRDAYVIHSRPGLDDAALDAVWQWRFEPARTKGEPVAVWVRIPVRFTLR
jgi:TonB family protein